MSDSTLIGRQLHCSASVVSGSELYNSRTHATSTLFRMPREARYMDRLEKQELLARKTQQMQTQPTEQQVYSFTTWSTS